MGERQAQQFWDEMWHWERYETFPGESTDDPHLVIGLGAQVDQAIGDGLSALRRLCREDHEPL